MSTSEFNDNYIKALERTHLYHNVPVELTKYVAPGIQDQYLIGQHNTIIELLVDTTTKVDRILVKLDQLLNKTSLEKSDIDQLTEQMMQLKPIEPKERMLPKEYKFGQARKTPLT